MRAMPVFAATWKLTLPLPAPLTPAVSVINGTDVVSLCRVQDQIIARVKQRWNELLRKARPHFYRRVRRQSELGRSRGVCSGIPPNATIQHDAKGRGVAPGGTVQVDGA